MRQHLDLLHPNFYEAFYEGLKSNPIIELPLHITGPLIAYSRLDMMMEIIGGCCKPGGQG